MKVSAKYSNYEKIYSRLVLSAGIMKKVQGFLSEKFWH